MRSCHAALQPHLPAISVGPHRRERVRAREGEREREHSSCSLRSLKTTNSILRRLGNHLINEISAHDHEQAEAELSTRFSSSSHSLFPLSAPSPYSKVPSPAQALCLFCCLAKYFPKNAKISLLWQQLAESH